MIKDVSGIANRAAPLLLEVEKRRRPIQDRDTRADDADLDRVAALLHAVIRADPPSTDPSR